MENTATQSIGLLYGKKSIFLRESVGEATIENIDLDLCSVFPSRAMGVFCEETGKSFIVTWAAVVRLAVESGILENDNEQ